MLPAKWRWRVDLPPATSLVANITIHVVISVVNKRVKAPRRAYLIYFLSIQSFLVGLVTVFAKRYLVQCNFTIATSAAWLCARSNLTNFEGEIARFMNQYDHGTVDNRKVFSFPWTDRLSPYQVMQKASHRYLVPTISWLIRFQPKDIWRCIAPCEEAASSTFSPLYEAGIHLSKANDGQVGSRYHISATTYTAIARCSESYEVHSGNHSGLNYLAYTCFLDHELLADSNITLCGMLKTTYNSSKLIETKGYGL